MATVNPGSLVHIRLSAVIATAAAVIMAVATGCASYVNIPSESRDAAIHDANALPAPTIMAEAMKFAVRNYPAGDRLVFTLPFGSSEGTYTRVWRSIDDDAEPVFAMEAIESGAPLYQLIALRIRGDEAVAQVILPEAFGRQRLLEVNLDGGIGGWRIINSQRRYPLESDIQLAMEQLDSIIAAATPAPDPEPTVSDDAEISDAGVETGSEIDSRPSGAEPDDMMMNDDDDSMNTQDEEGRPLTPVQPARGDGGQ